MSGRFLFLFYSLSFSSRDGSYGQGSLGNGDTEVADREGEIISVLKLHGAGWRRQ